MKWTLLTRESRASVWNRKHKNTMMIAEIPAGIIWAPDIPGTPLVPAGLLVPWALWATGTL